MRPTAVTDTLTQFTRFWFVNAYLVREDDGFTLVDTGMPGCGRRLHPRRRGGRRGDHADRPHPRPR